MEDTGNRLGAGDEKRLSSEEEALIGRILDGDEAAFARLVGEHHQALLRLAQVFVSSRAVAEEVVQDTWLAVLEGLSRFEGRSSLKTWIYRILTNRAKTRGVREGRTVPLSSIGPPDASAGDEMDPSRFRDTGMWADPPKPWEASSPERLALDREIRHHIETAIEELPTNQRAVILLRDVQGWSSREACELLEISEVNQRVLLHRARTRVRATIARRLERK